MTPDDGMDSTPDHRSYYTADGDEIEVREDLDGQEGMFEIRMPIASTGQVRNEGDDPLTPDEVAGMAEQVASTDTGVFPEHGKSSRIDPARYSQFERLGNWVEGDVESREAEDILMATARLADPETLPAATGKFRESLAILKEQAKRGIGINSSIGWREAEGFPGGNDLMEASIVGIGADWRTNTGDEAAEVVAHAAVDAGANPDDLVEAVRDAVAEPTDHDMTDEDTESADEADDTNDADESPDEAREVPEWAERLVELQEQQMDTLEAIADSVRPKDEEDDEDDDEEDDDEDQSADAEDADEAEPDDAQGLEAEVESLREELDDLRDGGLDADDVDTPDADDEQAADEPSEADDHELTSKYGIEQ